MVLVSRLNVRSVLTQVARFVSSKQLVFEKYGDPAKVLSIKTTEVGESVGEGEVLLQWMASPINPADINMIQGVYPIKPTLPAVGGNEGVAKVLKTGAGVRELSEGDWVIPGHAGMGTWTTHSVAPANQLFRIDSSLPLHLASSFLVNPPTAYRMLKDFQDISPGDVVVQNGANSSVGKAVIQIAKELGIRTVNIIRNRENVQEVEAELRLLGGNVVLTEEDFRSATGVKAIKKLGKTPKLALNCVGYRSTLHLIAYLGKKGKLVTYGGMSKFPFQVPTAAMIFREIECHGFWMSRWYTYPENDAEKKTMMKFLTDLALQRKLLPPVAEELELEDYKTGIDTAISGTGKKQIIIFGA